MKKQNKHKRNRKKVWMDENCFKMRHELLSLAKKLQLNPQNNHFLCKKRIQKMEKKPNKNNNKKQRIIH